MMKIQTMTPGGLLTAVLVTLALLAPTASASQMTQRDRMSVTTTDIQRLQEDVFQASSDLSRLRSNEPDQASSIQRELDDLRDEVIYLKVKLRKEGSVTQREYADVRDRIAAVRSRARGDAVDERRGTWAPPARAGVSDTTRPQAGTGAIPVGQEIDVRLQSRLSSATAEVEDRFEATTVVDLYQGNEVLIPAGSVLRGVVRTVQPATRTDRKGELTVSFDQITARGRTYPMRGTVTQAIESEGVRGEAGRIGAGAGVGAIIGGILGGVKGALLGVLIGGGGTIAATEGQDVTLDPGTILRVRLDTPPAIK